MGRTIGWNGSAKTIAATTVQTLTWTSSDLPSTGLVALHLCFLAAGNILSDITRLRWKAGGVTIGDCTVDQLRSFIEATSPGNYAPATSAQAITIPFYDLLQPTRDMQDMQQFPAGQPCTVEVTLGSGSAAGSALIGWTQNNDIRPVYYPRLLSSATGLPVSVSNGRVPFTELGEFRGFSLSTVGLNRVRCVAGGTELVNVSGVQTNGGDLFNEANRLAGVQTITDPIWCLLDSGRSAPPGDSFFELDTTSATAAGEICVYGRDLQRV